MAALSLLWLLPSCSSAGDGDQPDSDADVAAGDGDADADVDADADGDGDGDGDADDEADGDLDGAADADEEGGEDGGDEDAPAVAPHELRGIIHAHTAYSHDGCDENGVPDPECTAQLREAACELELDFVSLTDHPANMRDYPFEDLLLYDSASGDELVLEDGEPIANRVACPGGASVLFKSMQEVGLKSNEWYDVDFLVDLNLSLIHISEPTRPTT